jgi:regulator of sigma E protease
MSQSVKWEIITSKTDLIPFDILRDGKPMRIEVNAPLPKPDKGEKWYARIFRRPRTREVGLAPATKPVFVGTVMKNSPAEQAGIRELDELLEMDGKPLYTFATLALHVAEHKPESVSLKIQREGKPLEITIRPRVPEVPGDYDPTTPRVGMVEMADDDPRRPEQYRDTQLKRDNPLALIIKPIKSMYLTLAAVSTPGTGVGPAHLSGAPMILNIYYKMLADDPEGWRRVLWFSVFLNVNLAIMNLLPIPVLDGGHIMTSLYEMIARRPLPAEVMRVVYQGCALLLFGFMIFISGFDFRDIFQQSAKEKKPFEFLATGATS